MNWKASLTLVLAASVLLAVLSARGLSKAPADTEIREGLNKTMQAGNFNEAYQGFRRLALDPQADPTKVGDDLAHAVQCLNRLNRVKEIDELIESTVEAHAGNWRALWAAAQSYMAAQRYGYMIAGQFERGPHRGGGRVVNSNERDRMRAMQLMEQARGAIGEERSAEVSDFYLSLASILLNQRGYAESWRLQYLSDLAELPDYDEGWHYARRSVSAAPVDAKGNPVFHTLPESWEAAETDGQRWRWALHMAAEVAPERLNRTRMELAKFLHNQFGVQTMAQYSPHMRGRAAADHNQDQSGTYALHTLSQEETIARLAVGIRRFDLPQEFNFIKLYQQIMDDDKTGFGEEAAAALAQIFENRRQYPEAADYWRKNIDKYGKNDAKELRLQQIVGNWGRFEPIMAQPAGQGATVEFRFRNGRRATFEAHAIKTQKLLEDLKAYLKSNPGQLDWNRINLGNIGYRLIHQNQAQYVGEQVAQWDLPLEPRPEHYDRRITVTTPLEKPGAYLLKAKMADGNVSHIVIWVADTSIVKKPMPSKALYFVADAVTGKPIPEAQVELFGYRQRHVQGRQYQVTTRQSTEVTDADGQVVQPVDAEEQSHQWLVTATTKDGRFAYLGFTNVWRASYYDAQYNQVKVFTMTDRPVYRPGQEVKFKFWVRHAQYDMEDSSQFAHQSFQVEIRDPKGDKILSEQMTADEFGGIEGQFELPYTATLGSYGVYIVNRGGGSFRVEEYKKPEFEVKIEAPQEPVMLGEKINAKIEARYYFGAPVTQGTVKYKVLRTSYTEPWFPPMRWDWLYGPGYWWASYEHTWYPGWEHWGCRRPWPWWWHRGTPQPEVVAELEAEIGDEGTIEVEIDTALAQAIHPDQDHRYEITAEVVDQSRRTIVGTGQVLVARQPFKITTWLDRGYYRASDVVGANFAARTLDGQPVQGTGKLTLYQVSYDEKQEPVEKPVREWELNTDAQGTARLQFQASRQGQYRLAFALTDAAEHKIEGGTLFTIIGDGFDGADFRFNKIELIPDKRHYEPGDKVQLQVNTDRAGSTVLLFVRPANGVYLPPRLVRMEGKSTVVEIDVTKRDMPNFFVEGVTVADGQVYTETRELHVPPEKRVLGVELVASAETYRPGQAAKVRLKLTDSDGKPFKGSTVLTIYDKALEYISGGSNVPEIKEFFWKWRRGHSVRTESNLQWWSGNITLPNRPGMSDLGVFGASVPEEAGKEKGLVDGLELAQGEGGAFGGVRRQLGQNRGGELAAADAALPMAPAAAFANGLREESRKSLGADRDAAPGQALDDDGAAPPDFAVPTIRTQFADLALWAGSVTTGDDGVAEVDLTMPENLTTWKIKAWSMGHGTKVGQGEAEVITRKDLIVRLQAPRFFVEKDEVVLSANVHNYLDKAKNVQVVLELDRPELRAMDEMVRHVEVAAGGETRVDWRVKVVQEGQAVVRMKALTDEESDAMQMSFPVYVHGMLKTDSFSGALRPDDTHGKFVFQVPQQRRADQSRLEVRYSPTLAGAMVDALPYLVDYPYGCTEQTLNRFLPAVITQQVLIEMGLDLQEIGEKRTNLNAQEIGDDAQRAKGWKRFDRNPVFEEVELGRIVREGVTRLAEMQLSDGGWGWFSGWGERSGPHTTALVVHGLQVARQNDVALIGDMLERGVAWLQRYQDHEVQRLRNADGKRHPWKEKADNIDALVYMVLVDAGVKNDAMLDFLYRDRVDLSVYAKAMYGLALLRQGEEQKLAMIMRNIEQFVVEDDENQTAWLNLPAGAWWYWYGSEYEAHAFYLKLLAARAPESPVASRMVKYLLNNRKHATYWNSTRDTAYVVEAFADYLRASAELKPDLVVEVWLNGQKQKQVEIKGENLFTFDNKFVLEGAEIESGQHTLELRKQGQGPLYFNAYLTNFTLEDHITAAGLELKVDRKYYRLHEVDKKIKVAGSQGQAVDQKVEKYEREEIPNLGELRSGDLVEIELAIESKNDYEYLLLEDLKAAGFEPVDLRSGYGNNELGAYMELRDDRVSFFARRLARGNHSVSYRMRAEIPGRFSALPTRISAMYAPELRGNSDEIKVQIVD